MFVRRTPPISGDKSIATLEAVHINGVRQMVLIRGENRENPILLFLHGGPGSAQIGFARHYLQELERDFVVVNWDQRGAGLSYSAEIPPGTMTIEQMIEDTRELTEMLLKRFGQQKLFVVGHSWGTALGTMVAARYPHLFHAYIGMGQVVNMTDNEAVSYRYVLDTAKQRNHTRALRELQRIGPPPYPGMKQLGVQRKWLGKFGGSMRKGSMAGFIMNSLLRSKEYTLWDFARFLKGNMFSIKYLWDELMVVNLPVQVPELKVPVYFVLGRYDYNTPSELAVAYLQELTAPHKELIWLEESAHMLVFEEPERFAQAARKVLADHHRRNGTESAGPALRAVVK